MIFPFSPCTSGERAEGISVQALRLTCAQARTKGMNGINLFGASSTRLLRDLRVTERENVLEATALGAMKKRFERLMVESAKRMLRLGLTYRLDRLWFLAYPQLRDVFRRIQIHQGQPNYEFAAGTGAGAIGFHLSAVHLHQTFD